MHLTSSPLTRSVPDSDDQTLRTLMEADAPVRLLLLNHLCDGDELRRVRLSGLVEAALEWRAHDKL